MPAKTALTAAIGLMLSQAATGGPEFSEWNAPQATAFGGCPIESRDGNRLFTASGSAAIHLGCSAPALVSRR